jgi:5-methylcytosine-specific restriction protein B
LLRGEQLLQREELRTETKGNRFIRYFPVLLDALQSSAPAPMRPADAIAWIRGAVDVPEEDIARRIVGDSPTIFENQVHWACFYLAKAGLIASPRRGLWGPTPAGCETQLTPQSARDLYVRIRDTNRSAPAGEGTTPAPEGDLEEDGPSYWFAGSMWGRTDDQTDRFLAEGTWSTGP